MKVSYIPADGAPVATTDDALSLIHEAGADWVAVPVERLDPAFFDLSTRLAGEIIQKFANYRVGLAIVGDIGDHLAASSALRDYVREANRGRHVWFVADADELRTRLRGS